MTTIAFDLGISTGVAIGTVGGVSEFGTTRYGQEVLHEKLARWASDLIGHIGEAVEVVAYERPITPGRHMPLNAIFPIHQEAILLVAVESMRVNGRRIEVRCAPPSTIKKDATGNGRADKKAMTQAASMRWGVKPKTPHEADALCVLAWSVQEEFR